MGKKEKGPRNLAMLRYQAEHYRAAGNGSMSQQIIAEIRRLYGNTTVSTVKS